MQECVVKPSSRSVFIRDPLLSLSSQAWTWDPVCLLEKLFVLFLDSGFPPECGPRNDNKDNASSPNAPRRQFLGDDKEKNYLFQPLNNRPNRLIRTFFIISFLFDKFCYNSKFIKKKNESSPFKVGKPTNRVFSKNYNNPAFSSSFCTRRDTAYCFTSLAGTRIKFSGTGKEGGSVTFRKSA